MISVSNPTIDMAELSEIRRVIESGQITYGPVCRQFESTLSRFLNIPFGHAVSNGTAALHLALLALDVGPGDEVIVPDMTFIATANAVRYVGATPVFVDVHPETWVISPEAVARACTARTRAVIPVQLYGWPAPIADIRAAAGHRVAIVEDAAEGLGGRYQGRPIGTHGDIGCFSFYGNKILTTGEGGFVVTSSERLSQRIQHLRGQAMTSRRYEHDALGYNYRMTDLQAAIGLAQLDKMAVNLRRRYEIVTYYRRELKDAVAMQALLPGQHEFAPWLFTCLLPPDRDRDAVAAKLNAAGIETRPTFVPLHLQPCFDDARNVPGEDRYVYEAAKRVRCPITTEIGRRGLSLPTHPGVSLLNLEYIVRTLREAIA